MSIGERIRYFRLKAGLTQKALGMMLGFPKASAEVRIAQYESGSTKPRAELLWQLADLFGISVDALDLPDIEDPMGLMHTLFALEDIYGFHVADIEKNIWLHLCSLYDQTELDTLLSQWSEKAEALQSHTITQEEYDDWRYTLSEGKE